MKNERGYHLLGLSMQIGNHGIKTKQKTLKEIISMKLNKIKARILMIEIWKWKPLERVNNANREVWR